MTVTLVQRLRLRWYKLRHWEFWSFNAIYLPVIPYYIFLSAKARSFFFFNAANPAIKNGGFLMESKWDIYQQLPMHTYPATCFVKKGSPENVLLAMASSFSFPFIAKPDIGAKGRGVVLIKNDKELLAYHEQMPFDYLLQDYIDYTNEAGIFYIKDPATGKGIITGVVEKDFLRVTGDGVSTVGQLLLSSHRFALYMDAIKVQLGADGLNKVLHSGEEEVVVPIGNHARGATFFDVTKKVKEQLQPVMDALCEQIPNFYFGRLDIRFSSWEEFFDGEQYAIIELNGAGSEPTHMYDPSNSIWQAWKEIITHWSWLYKISYHNRRVGYPYLSYREGMQMFREVKIYDTRLDQFVFQPPH
jgi:hypothetical protein